MMLRESSVDDQKTSNNLMSSTSPQHQAVDVAASGELTANSISFSCAVATANAAATATASSDNSCSTILMTTTTADNSISNTTTTDHIVNLISSNISFYPQHPFAPPNQPPMLPIPLPLPLPPKKKRSLPGNPDPNAEVIAMSPKSLLATNRFLCEVCNKGFQRDQNLQLHRRGHNLPWKLKQRPKDQPIKKKVYVCPEATCAHHDPARALGDLTGIKKHYSRKHGDKKWKCDKCTKRYAVHSDWKAHSKICGTKEYRCDCGTLFSRRDSFITHRAFCEALAGERRNPLLIPSHQSSSASATTTSTIPPLHLNCKKEPQQQQHRRPQQSFNNLLLSNHLPPWLSCPQPNYQPPPTQQAGSSAGAPSNLIELASLQPFMHSDNNNNHNPNPSPSPSHGFFNTPSTTPSSSTLLPSLFSSQGAHHMSATAMLQRAAQMGVTMSTNIHQFPSDLSPPAPSHHNHQINMTNPSRGHHHYHHHLQAASNSSSCGSSSTTTTHVSANANSSGHCLLAPLPPSSSELAASSLAYYSHDDHIYNDNNNKQLMMIGGDHQAGFNHHVMMMSSAFSNSNSSSASNSSAPAAPSSSSALAGFEEALMINGAGLMMNNVPSSTSTTRGGGGGGSDGLTRDFLGLRSVSQKELMNMAACGNMDRNQYHHHHTDQQLMSFTYGQENNNISPSNCTPNWQHG